MDNVQIFHNVNQGWETFSEASGYLAPYILCGLNQQDPTENPDGCLSTCLAAKYL